MTADGTGMYDRVPPPVDNDRVITGGLAMLPIACDGKLDLVLHSIEDGVVTLNNVVHVAGLAPIACYGKLDLILHSIEDVVVTLNNVVHVPGLGLKFLSLHAVGKKQAVVIDPVGVRVTPGRLAFPCNDIGSQLPSTRKVHKHQQQSGPAPVESGAVGLPLIAAATIAPATMPVRIKSMDSNDMHVSYSHAH